MGGSKRSVYEKLQTIDFTCNVAPLGSMRRENENPNSFLLSGLSRAKKHIKLIYIKTCAILNS